MGKPSAKQKVVEYRLSVHMGFCLGVVTKLLGVYVDDKTAWEGEVVENGIIDVNQPNLFGGPSKQGGLVGSIYALLGGPNQEFPEELARRYGLTTDTSPGFRGFMSLFFVANGAYSDPPTQGNPIDPAGLFGSTPPRPPATGFISGAFNHIFDPVTQAAEIVGGFLWSTNNPVVAQTVKARVLMKPAGLDPDLALIDGPVYQDANPAHIIYDVYRDPDGMGESAGAMDLEAYNYAAQVLYNEGFGLSLKWVKPTTSQDFINKVLAHIQGEAFLHPQTGLHTIKLLRDDYDVGSLPHITPDNANLSDFSRRLAPDIINAVTVQYTEPTGETTPTVTVHDLGSIDALGETNPTTNTYEGIRKTQLALDVASRDVRAAVAPLISCTAVVDRSMWKLVPGDVVLMSWPEYGITNAVMRVGKVGYGKPGDSKITIPLLQDIFSLEKRPVTTDTGPGFVNPSTLPTAMLAASAFTTPYYFNQTGILQSQFFDLHYPEVTAFTLAYHNDYDVVGYELVYTNIQPNGSSLLVGAPKPIIEYSMLDADMPQAEQSVIPRGIILNPDRGPRAGGFVFIGDEDGYQEICLVLGSPDGDWVVKRGILDTTPKSWGAGTSIWWVNAGQRIVDDKTVRAAGEVVEYQMLTRTSQGLLALEDAPVVDYTLTDRPYLPLRPANCKINGHGFSVTHLTGDVSLVFSWATRNRTLEEGQILFWGDAAVPPEYKQKTLVTIYDTDNDDAVIIQYPFWTDLGFTIPSSYLNRFSNVRVGFSSAFHDSDLSSLQEYSLYITGLAGNPSAPLPPEPDPLGDPPSPVLAPADHAFEITGSFLLADDGGQMPAIIVEGTQDNQDATGLVLRHQRTGSIIWVTEAPVQLNGRKITNANTHVAPQTEYAVEAAYVVNNVIGEWRALGTVTTGQLVAQHALDVEFVSGFPVDEVAQILHDATLTAKGLLDQALAQFQNDIYQHDLAFINGEWLGTVIDRVEQQTLDGDNALAQTLALIGAATMAGTAFILDLNTAMVGPTESLGDRLTAISASLGANNAAISAEASARVTAVAAVATTITTLNTTVTNNYTTLSGQITSEATSRTTADSTINATLTALNSTVTTNNSTLTAAISNEATTRASDISSLAGTLSTLSSTVTGNYSTLTGLISTEATTRSTADTTINTTITTLTSTVSGNYSTLNSAIINEATTRAGADGTLTSTLSSLTSTVSGNYSTLSSAITAEATTRATNEGTTAATISALTSTVTGNYGTLSSAITNEQNTRISDVASLTSTLSTLSSTVGGNSVTLSVQGSTLATIQGRLNATWGVLVDINGRISGLQLNTVGGAGTVTATLKLFVTSLLMYNPNSGVDEPFLRADATGLFIGNDRVATESVVADALRKRYRATLGSNTALPTTAGGRVRYLSVSVTKDLAGSDIDIEGVMRPRPGGNYAGYLVIGYNAGGGDADFDTTWLWAPAVSLNGRVEGGSLATFQSNRIPVAYSNSITGLPAGAYTFYVDWVSYSVPAAGSFMEAGSTMKWTESKRAS